MEMFVTDQRQILSFERDAELEESRLLKSNVSLHDHCQKGGPSRGQATGLNGRLVLTMESRVHNHQPE